jgi:hypothetical protein
MANQTLHIYTANGRHAFYRIDNNVYDASGGERAFWASGTWWHSHEGGAEYYESGKWV